MPKAIPYKYKKLKKQPHYIYVALSNGGIIRIAFYKFNKDCKSVSKKGNDEFNKIIDNLKLKPGEQKKVPILIDEAEEV